MSTGWDGLVTVADVELTDHDVYGFDTLAVWADEKGFYLGTDSGCSCPIPFEDYQGRESMTGPLTTDQALEECSNLKAASGGATEALEAWNTFIETVRGFKWDSRYLISAGIDVREYDALRMTGRWSPRLEPDPS